MVLVRSHWSCCVVLKSFLFLLVPRHSRACCHLILVRMPAYLSSLLCQRPMATKREFGFCRSSSPTERKDGWASWLNLGSPWQHLGNVTLHYFALRWILGHQFGHVKERSEVSLRAFHILNKTAPESALFSKAGSSRMCLDCHEEICPCHKRLRGKQFERHWKNAWNL